MGEGRHRSCSTAVLGGRLTPQGTIVVAGPRTLHWRNLVALTTVCTVNGKVVIEVDALVTREARSTNRL